MRMEGSDEIPAPSRAGTPDGGPLELFASAARIGGVVGAVGSLALMLRAGRDTPRFLLVLFVFWVLAPFVALGWANLAAPHWARLTRATLYGVTLVIVPGSLAIYAGLVSPPAGSAHAAMFVAVPPGSCLLLAIAVPVAAWIARRRAGGIA